MSIVIIPIENAELLGKFYFSVTLGGVDFQLDFHYNDRSGFWYLNLYDAQRANLLRSGVKCVINYALLRTLVDVRRPVGELVVADVRGISGTGITDPGLEDLGTDARLVYVELCP